jgi:hypothetical protein
MSPLRLTHPAVPCCCARCARCAPQIILVRLETSPEDVGGMHAAQGILTARGGMTSHAAVVARGWGRPCVCGVDKLQVGGAGQLISFHGRACAEARPLCGLYAGIAGNKDWIKGSEKKELKRVFRSLAVPLLCTAGGLQLEDSGAWGAHPQRRRLAVPQRLHWRGAGGQAACQAT